MNKIFKVVWNEARRAYVVVSEYAKAQGKGCSGKKLLAMLIAAGVLSCPMYNVAEAETLGTATESQYVAIRIENPSKKDPPTKTIGGYTYKKTKAEYTDASGRTQTVYYYVRDGYTIKAEYNHLYNFSDITGASTDYTISTYKTGTTEDTGLLKSNQVLVTASNVTTLTNGTINDATTGTFVGSSNSEGVKAEYGWNYIIYDSNNKYVDVSSNMDTYFHEATVDSTTGQYTYKGEVIAPENLYVLTRTNNDNSVSKILGFFTTKDQELYKGSVFGLHNEVLMTTKEGDTLYSYWGAETDDPNQTIGSMRVGQLNDMFTVVENNIKSAMGDDIKSIKTEAAESGNGGTINLIRRGVYNTTTGQYEGEYSVAGGLTIQSTGGTGGNDVAITMSGDQSGTLTLAAGSKVVANNGNGGTDLNTLTINGQSFNVTGQTYTPGTNITIEDGVISATDTKYTVTPGSVVSGTNEVRAYDINESGNTNNPIAHIVDTDTKYTFSAAAGTGSVVNTYTITPNDGTDPTTIVDTDTNTTYRVENGTVESNTNQVKAYDIYGSDSTTAIAHVVDTDTKYTVTATAGSGNVKNTYTITGSDGSTLTQIVDTDTNTTYAQGNGVTITGADNTIAVKAATNAGLTVDTNGVSVNVGDGLTKINNVISVDNSEIDLTYKANGSNGQTVKLNTGLNFSDGTNTNATVAANGVVKFNLNDTISLTSVTTGGVSMSANGLDAGSKVISNVANGAVTSTSTDAINGSQLYAVDSKVTTNQTNITNLQANDIDRIQTAATTNGGTINLIRTDATGSAVAGGLSITSGGGSGSDTFITITGKNGTADSSITLNTGSKVAAVGTTDNLTGVTINGTSYNIKPYIGGGQYHY